MRRLFLLWIILACIGTGEGKNPFARYGYPVKVATMSNGKYEEFHDTERYVVIGSVLFDTETQTVAGRAGTDTCAPPPRAICRYISIDPEAERYYSISPYAYCTNNPLKYVDKDGKKIYPAPGTSQQFMKELSIAVRHLNRHGASGLIKKINDTENIYYIKESSDKGSYFNAQTQTIEWNPSQAMITTNGTEISPATLLNHEFDHAVRHETDAKQQALDQKKTDKAYGNKEEERVITGSEQKTAKALGEIKEGKVTRTDHYGSLYETTSPISTERKNKIIVTAPRLK